MAKAQKDIESTIEELMASEGYEARKEAVEPERSDAAQSDASAGGLGGGSSDVVDLADEIEALRAERDQYRDRFMRALAEAENARKRFERERKEAESYGGSKLSRDMLPVFDNLKRALEAISDDQRQANASLIEGIELTMRELLSVFARHGIELIDPEIGERFDPKLHQAMFEAPLPGTKAGDIIQVMAPGFMLHDRLLRAAQVGVSSTPKS